MDALQENWRRVASTHHLQDLLVELDVKEVHRKQTNTWVTRLMGGVILVASLAVCIASTCYMVHRIRMGPQDPVPTEGPEYYALALPLMVPTCLAAVFLRWFFLKLFKHNQ